jgi:hypothetical protein
MADKTLCVTSANGEGPIGGWRTLFSPVHWLAVCDFSTSPSVAVADAQVLVTISPSP